MTDPRSVEGSVSGRVQGVGFRYFVLRHAQAEGLSGFVRNLADGRVEFRLCGDAAAVARVLGKIRQGPSFARVDGVELRELDAALPVAEFVIR